MAQQQPASASRAVHAEPARSERRERSPPPQPRTASKLTASNLEQHTTGRNAASSWSNVRKYLHGMRDLPAYDHAENRLPEPPNNVKQAVPAQAPLRNNRVRELSNGSDMPLQPRSRKSPSNHVAQTVDPALQDLPVVRPASRGSLHASMKSRHSSGDPDKQNQGQRSSNSRTPELAPRNMAEKFDEKSKGKGKGRGKSKAPSTSSSLSSSSDDIYNRAQRAKGLLDKLPDGGKGKDKVKSKRKKRKRAERVSDTPPEGNEKEEKKKAKKRKADAETSKSKAKEAVDSDRDKVLAGRLERRREKALIVKDRSTVTAASKKAKAAQARADESVRNSKDESKRKSSKSKGKMRAEASDSEASRSVNGEYEDGLDITTAGKEEKRKKLKATEKSVEVLREAGQGGRKDPLRRASNMPQSGRITLKSGIYQNGHASSKVKVPPLSDLAFNESPFLDQKPDEHTAQRHTSSSRQRKPVSKRPSKAASEANQQDSEDTADQRKGREPSAEIRYKPVPRRKSKALPWMAPEYAIKPKSSSKGKEQTREVDLPVSDRAYKPSKLDARETRPSKSSSHIPIRSPARHSAKRSEFSYRDHSIVAESSRADIPSSDFGDGLSAASLARRRKEAKEPSVQQEMEAIRPRASTSRLPPEPPIEEHGQFAKAGAAIVQRKKRASPARRPQPEHADLPRSVPIAMHDSEDHYAGLDIGQEGSEILESEMRLPEAGPSRWFGHRRRVPPDMQYWQAHQPVSRCHNSILDASFDARHDGRSAGALSDVEPHHVSYDDHHRQHQIYEQQYMQEQYVGDIPSSPSRRQTGFEDTGHAGQPCYAEQDWQSGNMQYEDDGQDIELDLDAIQRTLDFQPELERAERSSAAWLFSSPKPQSSHANVYNARDQLSGGPPYDAQQGAFQPSAAALMGLDVGPSREPEPLESRFSDFWKLNRP